MRKLYLFIAILVTLIASSIPSVVSVNAQDPIVYAVLFTRRPVRIVIR